MPSVITPVIAWPANFSECAAGDAVNGSNELSHSQKVVNALAYLKDQIEKYGSRHTYAAEFSIPSQLVADGDYVTGYTPFSNNWPLTGGWGVSGAEIEVPAEGMYYIEANIYCASSGYGRLTLRLGTTQLDSDKLDEPNTLVRPNPRLLLRCCKLIVSPGGPSGKIKIWNQSDGTPIHDQLSISSGGSGVATSRIRIFKVAGVDT